jgi:hypothetical protein
MSFPCPYALMLFLKCCSDFEIVFILLWKGDSRPLCSALLDNHHVKRIPLLEASCPILHVNSDLISQSLIFNLLHKWACCFPSRKQRQVTARRSCSPSVQRIFQLSCCCHSKGPSLALNTFLPSRTMPFFLDTPDPSQTSTSARLIL